MEDLLAAVPVVVRVDGAAAAPAPPRAADGPLAVTGLDLVLVPLALAAVVVGALLRRAGR